MHSHFVLLVLFAFFVSLVSAIVLGWLMFPFPL